MRKRLVFLTCVWRSASLGILRSTPTSAQSRGSEPLPTWLWVIDWRTDLGISGASVEIGPGEICLGRTDTAAANWTAHYVTGPAGRILTHGLPDEFSCPGHAQ